MKHTLPCLTLSLAGLIAGIAQPVHAAPPALFYGPQAHEIPAHVNLPVQALAGHYVRINHDLFAEHGLSLQLPNGKTVSVGRQRGVNHPNGSQTWEGGVVGDSDSSVILVQHGSALAGVIRTEDKVFKIKPAGNGVHMVIEVSPHEPFPELDPAVGDAYDMGGTSASATADVTGADDGSLIDVMVVYSSDTKDRYQGADGVNAMIATAIAETNQAYLNSGINTQLRLVHTAEVENSSGNMQTDLYAITDPYDGVVDHVHDLRDQYGADLVSWFNEAPSYCGIAWLNTGDLSYDAGNGFSVVASDCATGYFSTGHELGHNMGSAHDHANAGSAMYNYSYGYQDPQATFRTVMAYNCSGGCARVQHFSNPAVNFGGKPTGASDADNASSINQTRIPVSQWRSVAVNPAPSADFDFDCSQLSCTFTDTSSASSIVNWSWDFGDGTSSSNQNAQHTFAAPGVYTVALTITDDSGATGNQTRMVSVTDASASAPAAPNSLMVSDDGFGAALVTWADHSDNETGFDLERETQHPKNGKWVSLTTLSTGADTPYLTDETGAGSFRYRVRASNAFGASDWTGWQTVTVTDASGGSSGGGGPGSKGGNGGGKGKNK